MASKKKIAMQQAAEAIEETAASQINPTAEDFEWIGSDADSREAIARPSINFWKDAMTRLFRRKIAIVCIVILAVIAVMAIFAPMVMPFDEAKQHVTHTNAPMFTVCPDTGDMHIFGTDSLGRDLFVRMWTGARVSLSIALICVLVNCVIGLAYGGISGYFGGWLDNVMMRIIEIVSGIPYMIIVILLMMVMPRGPATIIIAYVMVGWTGFARMVRGQIISLKEQEFVVAAKAMGASPARIIGRHLIPNILSVIIVQVTIAVPGVIFTEAFLSFVGLGVPVPMASWGTLANEGAMVFRMYPSQMLIPSILICLTMLSFNLLGDALRDSFDPKLRS